MSAEVKLTVLLFASVAEAAGVSRWDGSIQDGDSIANLRERLREGFPAIKHLLSECRFACNEVFVEDQHRLAEGDTVAVIPPVAGG